MCLNRPSTLRIHGVSSEDEAETGGSEEATREGRESVGNRALEGVGSSEIGGTELGVVGHRRVAKAADRRQIERQIGGASPKRSVSKPNLPQPPRFV